MVHFHHIHIPKGEGRVRQGLADIDYYIKSNKGIIIIKNSEARCFPCSSSGYGIKKS